MCFGTLELKLSYEKIKPGATGAEESARERENFACKNHPQEGFIVLQLKLNQ